MCKRGQLCKGGRWLCKGGGIVQGREGMVVVKGGQLCKGGVGGHERGVVVQGEVCKGPLV